MMIIQIKSHCFTEFVFPEAQVKLKETESYTNASVAQPNTVHLQNYTIIQLAKAIFFTYHYRVELQL